MDRLADRVPACFEADSGAFDVQAVEEFFAARRGEILDPKGLPLVPLSRLSKTVQRRWREYLAWVASQEKPMNGVQMGSGKLAPSVSIDEVKVHMAGAVARGAKLIVSKALQEAVATEERPWEAAGLSRTEYYRRKKAGTL